MYEEGGGQGAGPRAEVEHQAGTDRRDGGRGCGEHELIARDEATDRLVIGIDVDAQMLSDAVGQPLGLFQFGPWKALRRVRQ